jgi:hypothetical protein
MSSCSDLVADGTYADGNGLGSETSRRRLRDDRITNRANCGHVYQGLDNEKDPDTSGSALRIDAADTAGDNQTDEHADHSDHVESRAAVSYHD